MSLLRLYGRVLALLGPERKLAVWLAIANAALALALYAEPVLFGRIVDRFGAAQSAGTRAGWHDLLPLVATWAAFGLFTILAGLWVGLDADRLTQRRRLGLVATYFEHVIELPLLFHGATHSGRLLKTMLEGVGALAGLWLSFFRDRIAALVSLVVLLPVALWVNPRLAVLLIALVVLFVGLTILVLRRTEHLQGEAQRYHSDLAERASDVLGNVAVIQSFTRIGQEAEALRGLIRQALAAQMPVLVWWAVLSVATRSAGTLSVLAIVLYGTALYIDGQTTVGQIVTFVNFSTMLLAQLQGLVSFINTLFLEAGKIGEFLEVLDTAPGVRDAPDAVTIGRATGRVTFEDVAFSYDRVRPAVQGLTFTVEPGETIALVGETGSGKSTTLGLLHRAFDPDQGSVTLDGQDIRRITLASLRRNIGVVFQEPMLFARSIEENLRVGKPDATPAEIAAALDKAQAADFVGRQTGALSANVGERGRRLSGGERQRLAIARALIKDPPILILDEATAALDALTEQKLQQALDGARAGRTTFVIAHRLATVRRADRIFVLSGGRIVEAGSFDHLLRANGAFAALARAQHLDRLAPEPPDDRTPIEAAQPAATAAE